jgi:hypothetical protein
VAARHEQARKANWRWQGRQAVKSAVSAFAAVRLKYVVRKKAPNKTRFQAWHVDIPESHLGVAQKIGEN